MQKHKHKQGNQVNVEINHGTIHVTNTHDTNLLERMIKKEEIFNEHLGHMVNMAKEMTEYAKKEFSEEKKPTKRTHKK